MKRKKQGLAIKIVVLAFAVYSTVILVSLQLQINAAEENVSRLKIEVSDAARQNAELNDMLNAKIDDEYIAKIAREKLGYGAPNERIFETK